MDKSCSPVYCSNSHLSVQLWFWSTIKSFYLATWCDFFAWQTPALAFCSFLWQTSVAGALAGKVVTRPRNIHSVQQHQYNHYHFTQAKLFHFMPPGIWQNADNGLAEFASGVLTGQNHSCFSWSFPWEFFSLLLNWVTGKHFHASEELIQI